MKLDIVIPSLNRMEKLNKCINSIFVATSDLSDDIFRKVNIHLYFSLETEFSHYQGLFTGFHNVHVHLLKDYRVPDFWNSHLKQTKADMVMYVNDDVLFHKDTVQKIFQIVTQQHSDFDCLLGIKQDNLPQEQALDSAFGLIGAKYADRFPDRNLWCPDYYRFYCDREMGEYAKSINKFTFYPEIRINHLHPCTNKKLIDETHHNVREYLGRDKETFKQRQAQGLLWGKSFELVAQ